MLTVISLNRNITYLSDFGTSGQGDENIFLNDICNSRFCKSVANKKSVKILIQYAVAYGLVVITFSTFYNFSKAWRESEKTKKQKTKKQSEYHLAT